MQPEENNIAVWVCQEEKLVFGLSKRTTCAEVVRVLLDDQNLEQSSSSTNAMLSGAPHSYCIVEKWRGFERILPNKTKLLRLWSAWGDEQENVRFVLVKNGASLTNRGPRSAEARVVLSRDSPHVAKGSAKATAGFSPEMQRRIVRKAFRKLERMNKKKAKVATRGASCAGKMETLVHLVISQDHTIRQQIDRITELDVEIERYEAKVHFDRMRRHGVNYVQDTYLVDTHVEALPSSDGQNDCSPDMLAKFEEYARQCDEVVKFQEELDAHEVIMDSITAELQEELNHRWMRRRQEAFSCKHTSNVHMPHTKTPETDISENELLLEEERIKTQLDTSLYIGLRLNTDLETISNDLKLTQEIWEAKEKEIKDLLEKVNSLEIRRDACTDGSSNHTGCDTGVVCAVETKSGWVEQARGLSKTCNNNDDDSDTGLSSLHSQDSDNLLLCESSV